MTAHRFGKPCNTNCPCGRKAVGFTQGVPICAECLRIERWTSRHQYVDHRATLRDETKGMAAFGRALSRWMAEHGIKQELT